jgi:tetratricopeptide (TPR) repeat protein
VVLQDLGRLEEAREAYRRALAREESALGVQHRQVGLRLSIIAERLAAMGDVEPARAMRMRALEILSHSLPPHHPRIEALVKALEE